MDIKKITIGQRVIHKAKRYTGTVESIDYEKNQFVLLLDNKINGEVRKTYLVDRFEDLATFKPEDYLEENIDNNATLKEGDIVKHPMYGLGKIIGLNAKSGLVSVEILKDKARMMCLLQSLHKASKKEIDEYNQSNERRNNSKVDFTVGDNVSVEHLGTGVVVSVGEHSSKIRFNNKADNNGDNIKSINNFLISRIAFTAMEEDIVDEEIISDFSIIPSDYSKQSCYPTSAKLFLNALRKKYKNEKGIASIASYRDSENNEEEYVGLIILPKRGAIFFQLFNMDTAGLKSLLSSNFLYGLFEQTFKQKFKQKYFNKLLDSKNLCDIQSGNKRIKFPYKFLPIFQNVSSQELTDEEKNKISHFGALHNFTSSYNNRDFFDDMENESEIFVELDQFTIDLILERILPEYVTLTSVKPQTYNVEKATHKMDNFVPITGCEREYRAIKLEDEEIRIINDTKPGIYLTLANPGTGKSVILVSKAFRLATKNPNSRILITCYNRNLAEKHDSFAKISLPFCGNLTIQTFHSLVIAVLKKIDINFIYTNKINNESYDDAFDKYVDRLLSLLNEKKCFPFLDAVFIDEVQLMEPKWLDILYMLVKDKNNLIYEMYGDMNQCLRWQKSHGAASWQNTSSFRFKGRSKKLEINFRNSGKIAYYLNAMIQSFNTKLKRNGLEIDDELAVLTSKTKREGRYIPIVTSSLKTNVNKIVDAVENLIIHKADPSEIAIIFPARKLGKDYFPAFKIIKNLSDRGIPYDPICALESNTIPQKIFDCTGVIVSTIDSCLGLDFKYVILCGLHFFDYYFDDLNNKHLLTQDAISSYRPAKMAYAEAGKKIYTACSRARDYLLVIDDCDNDSPIKKIIRPYKGANTYEEKK